MPLPNPKNSTSAAAVDLGLTTGLGAVDASTLADEQERKKKLLQQQRERMGLSGASVYGEASMSLFSDAGNM